MELVLPFVRSAASQAFGVAEVLSGLKSGGPANFLPQGCGLELTLTGRVLYLVGDHPPTEDT